MTAGRKGMRCIRTAAILAAATLVLAVSVLSCSTLKTSRPLVPMREYEKMLVGSLFADYVGNENCLKACHVHDRNAAFLEKSVHGQQRVEGTGVPLVNCETCHGPGSEAVSADYINQNNQCDTSKFIPIRELPAAAQSLLCLKCHSAYSMVNVQFWQNSEHAMAEVSCPDCHKLHEGTRQKKQGREINDLCYSCHEGVRSQFSLVSRHPLPEGLMLCSDCHDPHGTGNPGLLIAADEKTLCGNCHAQAIGPYTFEHADVTDECITCHRVHGSMFADMLNYQEPFLCLQCHTGHTDFGSPSAPRAGVKQAFYTRCTNCHSQIHGTDTRGPHPGSGLTQ
ncbi:MAG: DmsE family decaheme c-type cytochrome [bacterium]|nr:MAG: DmsE family decaheme c-type cytochrome [bacterium]